MQQDGKLQSFFSISNKYLTTQCASHWPSVFCSSETLLTSKRVLKSSSFKTILVPFLYTSCIDLPSPHPVSQLSHFTIHSPGVQRLPLLLTHPPPLLLPTVAHFPPALCWIQASVAFVVKLSMAFIFSSYKLERTKVLHHMSFKVNPLCIPEWLQWKRLIREMWQKKIVFWMGMSKCF